MKILGFAKIKHREEFVLIGKTPKGEPVRVLIRPPSLGKLEQIDKDLVAPPMPQPPLGSGVQRNGRGEPLLDNDGRPIANVNTEDPAYLEALREFTRLCSRINRHKSLALVVTALGDQIELDAKPDAFSNKIAYYDAVWLEFEKIGIDVGRFAILSKACGKMTGITQAEIDAAREELTISDPT